VPRERNERLAALLTEAGWSRAQAANAFNRVAAESKLPNLRGISRSHISMWVGGTRPTGVAPHILSQALSRRLKRALLPKDLGFSESGSVMGEPLEWRIDPLISLNHLKRVDLDTHRRDVLVGAVYSATALALPGEAWWTSLAETPSPPAHRQHVGRGDVATVQELTVAFSRMDQQRGGGHGRKALAQYLHSDVTQFLRGTFRDEEVRRQMLSAAGELAYLSGWMAFDNAEHAIAQNYFVVAAKLAARAGNPPLAGHILRAMAHQALDLGFPRQALDLSTASIQGQRYLAATPREQALLGVIHARCLAANGRKAAAAKALLQ
jgi:hypothetical protein